MKIACWGSKMKNRTITLAALLLTVAMAGCATTDEDTVTIGALMPLTGEAAGLGVPAVQGARLAVTHINAAGGVGGLELVMHEGDTQFPNTQEAVAEYQRLAGEGIQFIVGALASDSSDAVKSRATEDEVILMSPSSTRPSLTGPDHGYFFRTIANDDVQGPQAAEIVFEDLEVGSTVVMFQQTGYAQGLRDTFVAAYEGLGGTVVGDPIAWENDESTFDSKAAEAAALDPEFIWVSGQAPEIANLISALRDQGYDGRIMASEAIEDSDIFDVAGEDLNDVFFTKSAPDPDRPEVQAFMASYEATYGESPGPFDAFAYDAVFVAAAAIEAVGNDGPVIKAWLEGGGAVDGRVTTQTIRFNSQGDITTGGYSLWQIVVAGNEGEFVPAAA